MKIGYARVSTTSQNLDMQVSALTDAGCDKMEPYGAIAEEGNKYQEEMSRKEKSPYCGGITIKRICEDYVEVESEEIKV